MDKDTAKHETPPIPLVESNPTNNVGYQDTLDRIAAVLHLLTELDLSEGLSSKAENGRYWVHLMLIDSINYVSDALANKTND